MQNPAAATARSLLMLMATVPLMIMMVLPGARSQQAELVKLTPVGRVSVSHQNCNITGQVFNVSGGSSSQDRRLHRFLGVPYAEPIDQLRFAPPLPLNCTAGLRHLDASGPAPPPPCPGRGTKNPSEEPEDCLLVSVRSPNLTGSLPVLAVLLADPAEGGVSHLEGDALVATEDVVMVTISARLGVLGNLRLGNDSGGNLGLADQRLALWFLNESVALFGGDPTRITLAGFGADAAAAVGLHAVSADGAGGGATFQSVVMTGGSVASPLTWSAKPHAATWLGGEFAESLGCGGGNNESATVAALSCLRNVTLEQLLAAEANLSWAGVRFAPAFPDSDDGRPDRLWRGGAFKGSLLIGAWSGAGLALAERALGVGLEWEQLNRSSFEALLDREFRYFPRLHEDAETSVRRYLRLALTDWPHGLYGAPLRRTLARALGDFHAVCPVWEAASDLAGEGAETGEVGGVFVYLFNVTDPVNPMAGPATDARYLLGEPLLEQQGSGNYPEEHRRLARLAASQLASFIAGDAPSDRWPPISTNGSSQFSYQIYGLESQDTQADGYGFGPGRCPMWSSEMPLVSDLASQSSPPSLALLRPPDALTGVGNVPRAPSTSVRSSSDDIPLANYTIRVPTYGSAIGRTIRRESGKIMTEYLGLPYAKPPLGSLRFAPPEWPNVTTNSTHYALEMPPACIQSNSSGLRTSEDCLYLNIWTPNHAGQSLQNLPVIVFLHGGLYHFGGIAESQWRGSQILDHHDVVVVSAAYRLGALGFLALPDAKAPGNYGLKDQEQAVEFVRRFISNFGGSRTTVTLMGVEAGAASIGYLLARPPQRFQRAVMLTGSPYLPYLVSGRLDAVWQLHANFSGSYLNCSGSDSSLMQCLRQLDASFIGERQAEFVRDLQNTGDPIEGHTWSVPAAFTPVVDGDFIKTDPLEVEPGQLTEMKVLLGGVDAPGNWLVERLNLGRDFSHTEMLHLLGQSVLYFPRYPEPLNSTGRDVVKARFTRYLNSSQQKPAAARDAQLLARALGNRHWTCPNGKFLDAITSAEWDGVYHFLFDVARNGTEDGLLSGAGLFEDAYYAMGNPAIPSQPHGEERARLSIALMQAIVDFARTGDPGWGAYNASGDRLTLLLSRPTGNQTSFSFLPDTYMESECAFWQRSLPCVYSPDCINEPLTTVAPPTTTPEKTTASLETEASTEPSTSSTEETTTEEWTGTKESGTTPEVTTPETTEVTTPETTQVTDTDASTTTTPDVTKTTMTGNDTSDSPTPTGTTQTDPSTSSSEVPTTSPKTDGGLSTLALVLIIVFSIVGAVLLAVCAFLVYKYCFSGGHPIERRVSPTPLNQYSQPPSSRGGQPAGGSSTGGAAGANGKPVATGSQANGQGAEAKGSNGQQQLAKSSAAQPSSSGQQQQQKQQQRDGKGEENEGFTDDDEEEHTQM